MYYAWLPVLSNLKSFLDISLVKTMPLSYMNMTDILSYLDFENIPDNYLFQVISQMQ